MGTNIFVYWPDGLGSPAFDHHSRNGGGAFASENCPQDRAFDQFLKMPGACPGGMLAAGINSHIIMYI